MERATEDTYVAELCTVIKMVGGPIGFDAEFNKKTPSGKADINLYFKGKLEAVIEVKQPVVPLSDPALKTQAERYAEWYRKNRNVNYYGVHNMKYLNVFKYVAKEKRDKTLLEYMGAKRADWAVISDFPFRIIPWAKSIDDFKQISANNEAQGNLSHFLLRFKELLEGKSIDLSAEVIEIVKRHIEDGASHGLTKFVDLYRTGEKNVRTLFEEWRNERGIEKPKNDDKLKELLTLMIKEQLYTLSMKVLFYLVLQNIDMEMSAKLKENLATLEPSDAELFQKIFDMLFKYAIERTGDFEEVFGTNTVDRLPLVDQTIQSLKELISYLNQIRWSEVNVDIIGRVFEGLIYTERRHMLGQHYTDTIVVDLILAATLREPGKLIDPSCGSGTFLVRALNYWKSTYPSSTKNFELVEGMDIDKLASMLSKVNLYIQGLEAIKEKTKFNPRIYHKDFFKTEFLADYSYVVTNPPYTRQEEMTLAFYDKEYKKHLARAVEDVEDWSKRSSIYAYFLVRGAKLLKEGGRLGFIVENSWLNSEYGGPLKNWFMKDFAVDYVIESLRERWFEDAAIITNIIVGEKVRNPVHITKFIYLKEKLHELFGSPPPANDIAANQRYYEKICDLFSDAKDAVPRTDYAIQEDDHFRIVSVKKSMLEKIERTIGKWGIIKGPKEYLEIMFGFLKGESEGLTVLSNVLELNRGLTTNANDIFYLPSKYWSLIEEGKTYLRLRSSNHKALKISKDYLRPLIIPAHLAKSAYKVDTLEHQREGNYVIWIEDQPKVTDPGMKDYLVWAENFIKEENETNGRFTTVVRKIDKLQWTKLPDTSNAAFLFRKAPYRNFSIFFNTIRNTQIDCELYSGRMKEEYAEVDARIIFSVLNSVLTYLDMELFGRANLGEGVLKTEVTDYNVMPILNPLFVQNKLEREGQLRRFFTVADKMLACRTSIIENELKRDVRMELEKLVLGTIGLSETNIFNLYKELQALIYLRTERASSYKKKSVIQSPIKR
jgi:type I restriction-modification system DNA methylase subunit